MEGSGQMKVAVLGNTGMLGTMVQSVLRRQQNMEVVGVNRSNLDLYPRSLNQIGGMLSKILGFDTDWVVNCMGATKPYFNNCSDLSIPIYANALFPHQLAQWAELVPNKPKVIHITTDCVYDGSLGRYDEEDPHSPSDYYGKSKSLGEPPNCMVLRTSIIGPEFGGHTKHFLSWVKSMDGKKANGYRNHLWNGLTTLELSYVILEIIMGDLYEEELYHLFSSDVTKYEMVKKVAEVYGLDIELTQVDASIAVDRRLRTLMGLNDLVTPHTFEEMLKELKDWEDNESAA